MAEGPRLNALCSLGTLSELAESVIPGSGLKGPREFQRRCVSDLVREVFGLSKSLSGPGARLMNWFMVRFRMENLKVLIRVYLAEAPGSDLQAYLLPLPGKWALKVRELLEAESFIDFIRIVPDRLLRDGLERAFEAQGDRPRPFFFEAALDHTYLQELLALVRKIPPEDREIVAPLAREEADIFHLTLVARGRFHYDLAPEVLIPLHVRGTAIPLAVFVEMLNHRGLSAAVDAAVGRVLDIASLNRALADRSSVVSADDGVYERLAWARFLRLSNLVFRRSHMGLAAVVGYVGIRRVEVANLITLSEGIRQGMAAEAIRSRMITGGDGEAVRV
jgi:vacuolar-type H+-ATPase subunit C/Vma6